MPVASFRRHNYVVAIHAEEEMSPEAFSILDVECGILTGNILENQKDDRTGESKYRIRGETAAGAEIELSCPACGESYMTAQTLYQIERLKRDRHRLAVGRKVGVVDFAA